MPKLEAFTQTLTPEQADALNGVLVEFRETLVATQRDALAKLTATHAGAIDALTATHAGAIDALTAAKDAALDKLAKANAASLATLTAKQQAALDALAKKHAEAVVGKDAELVSIHDALSKKNDALTGRDAALVALKMQLAEGTAALAKAQKDFAAYRADAEKLAAQAKKNHDAIQSALDSQAALITQANTSADDREKARLAAIVADAQAKLALLPTDSAPAV